MADFDKPVRKRYHWSSPFEISSMQSFTMKIDAKEMKEEDMMNFASIKN